MEEEDEADAAVTSSLVVVGLVAAAATKVSFLPWIGAKGVALGWTWIRDAAASAMYDCVLGL